MMMKNHLDGISSALILDKKEFSIIPDQKGIFIEKRDLLGG